MVVVAIVGVLAAVALYVYKNYVRKARAAEVPEMFGEFQAKEAAFHAEFGTYLSTGANESDFFPAAINGTSRTDISGMARPVPWQRLRISPSKNALWCQYVAIAGPAGDKTAMGALGNASYPTAPTTNWYYLVAQCNFDGDDSVNSVYFRRGDQTNDYVENEGR